MAVALQEAGIPEVLIENAGYMYGHLAANFMAMNKSSKLHEALIAHFNREHVLSIVSKPRFLIDLTDASA